MNVKEKDNRSMKRRLQWVSLVIMEERPLGVKAGGLSPHPTLSILGHVLSGIFWSLSSVQRDLSMTQVVIK